MNGEEPWRDLAAFLLARIGEDEAAAQAATPGPWEARPYWFKSSSGRSYATITGVIYEEIDAEDGVHIARWDPARALAECQAKRQLIEWDGEQPVERGVLRILALPYRDHPDYNADEWEL